MALGLMDIAVLAGGAFMMYKNSQTTGPSTGAGIKDLLAKIPFIGRLFGGNVTPTNDLLTKAQLWKQLSDAITDPNTKRVLNQIWPMLNIDAQIVTPAQPVKETVNAEVK